MTLSTIITAYRKNELVAAHVRECMNSFRMPDEIIVVNDGGPDELYDMLKGLDKKTKIIYAKIKEDIPWNYTGARNLGVWLSTGDILAMEDADNIPSHAVYAEAMDFFDKTKEFGRITSGKRQKVYMQEAIDKPMEEWISHGTRPSHKDTQFLLRETYLKAKGCDERFAGRYAWASTDWMRRLNRMGIQSEGIVGYYWAVVDGEVDNLVRRKSYTNYEFAREKDGHTQSPIGMLNFHYDFEVL
jgi:glycosyltransferase involved in cell wall biosynthesis